MTVRKEHEKVQERLLYICKSKNKINIECMHVSCDFEDKEMSLQFSYN